MCGIKKNLSTHAARHSYATSVCLANGVSIENVAKMLGHSNISMTKRYARVLDQSILNDMKKVGNLSNTLYFFCFNKVIAHKAITLLLDF